MAAKFDISATQGPHGLHRKGTTCRDATCTIRYGYDAPYPHEVPLRLVGIFVFSFAPGPLRARGRGLVMRVGLKRV